LRPGARCSLRSSERLINVVELGLLLGQSGAALRRATRLRQAAVLRSYYEALLAAQFHAAAPSAHQRRLALRRR